MSSVAHPMPHGFAPALVATILDDALARGTRILGISGLQGSGKSTLAAQLAALAETRGLRTVALSLDDFYLDKPEREQLARDVHPLLLTRGPPGTHDMALACDTLDALRRGDALRLPAFDKLSDRRVPSSHWKDTRECDLIVFEGWCLGATAETSDALVAPLNRLEREEDADGTWRQFCNDTLARDYPSLWQRVDRLVFLQPPSFDIVGEWRWQQEQALQAGDPSRRAMTRDEVDRFILHFERTSRQLLCTLPDLADVIIRLDADRQPLG